MQHNGAEGRAAHARVGDADHVLDPALREFFGDRQIPRFGHVIAGMGACVLQDEHVVGADVERGVVDARRKIGERGKDHRAAHVLEQFCIGRRALEDCALGGEIAEQSDEPALRLERLVALRNDRAVDVSAAIGCEAFAQRLPARRYAVEVQQRLELAQQRAHAAGGEKILHIAVADRLEIDQHGRRIGEPVELCERNFHAGASGDGGEVDHRVGRAAEREQGTQRVLDRFRVDDAPWRAIGADQRDGRAAGCFRGTQAVGMHGRDRGGSGQDKPERFGDAGHGRRGAHHRASAGGDRQLPFDLRNFLLGDLAGAISRPETPAVGAGAEPLAAVAASHHRACHQHDRRPAGGYRAHDLRRYCLVAPAHEHDRVHRLRPDHFLRVDRHQVAIFHAGRAEKHLAERDGGKRHRQRAGGEHPAPHRLEQFWEMPVAIVEGGWGIGDADHGLFQQRTRVAHGLRKGTPQVEREIAVAVVGETVLEPVFAHSLYLPRPGCVRPHGGNAEHLTAIRINFLTVARQLSPRQAPWNASNLGPFQKRQPAEAQSSP